MEKEWTTVIEPKKKLFELNLKEVWQYRDLIWLFVKRDFTTKFKQTILGPLWYIIQPLFTTIVQTFVFGGIAKLPTDGVPQFLFYMAGNVPWAYFSSCLLSTSNTFVMNSGVFGKVYFPRLTTPIATVISSLFNFIVQFVMFLGFTLYFALSGADITVTWVAALTPLFVIQMALLGMGFGIIISSMTTKYRDLMAKRPEFAFELAVKGMLGKNKLRAPQLKRLKVYAGSEHKHAAQKPEIWA